MIYYFSGTGNSEWVAKEIGAKLECKVVNIMEANREEAKVVKSGDVIGFIFPIYAWAPPEIMLDFIKKFTIDSGAFSFAICTCESEAGYALKNVAKQIQLNSAYSISMPNNYIISMEVDSDEVVKKKVEEASKSIEEICIEVSNKENVWRVNKGIFPLVKTALIGNAFNKYARSTKKFSVDDTCISCGLCQNNCPIQTIKLEGGKPVWGEECLQCLSCINRCPSEAIQFGKKTKGRGRYYFK